MPAFVFEKCQKHIWFSTITSTVSGLTLQHDENLFDDLYGKGITVSNLLTYNAKQTDTRESGIIVH